MSELEPIIKQILEVSPPVGLAIFLNVIGYLMKKSPIPSWTIPWTLILIGGAIFPFIIEDGTIVWNSRYPEVYTFMVGGMIGFASVGVYEVWSKLLGRKQETDPARTMPDSANGK